MPRMQLHMIPMHDLQVVADEAIAPPAVAHLDELTYRSWGVPLTLAQYLKRERRMRALPFSRGHRYWILRDGEAPLASCESYEVPLALSAARAAPRRGVVHGIASVFVEEKLRGHHYASTLLTRVHDHLAREGVLGCYLMSEIGPSLYARLGYLARPLRLCRYAAADPAAERLPSPLPWTWLAPPDLPALLAERYRAPKPALSIETNLAQLDWHLQRSRYYAQELGRPFPPHLGARSGDAFALWQASYPKNLLRVLMLYPGERLARPGAPIDPRGPELEAVRHVLHAARFTAAHLGLTHVEVWENPANSAYLRGGARLPSDDVPMLLPLSPDVQAEAWQDYERCHWL